MKHREFTIILLLLCLFLPGCGEGRGETGEGSKTEYRDIMVDKTYFPDFEAFFLEDGQNHSLQYLGTQFLGEEPVQLWAEKYVSGSHGADANLYLWNLDGERELIGEGISNRFVSEYRWYLAQDGSYYIINRFETSDLIRKLDSEGNEVFRIDDSVNWRPRAVCQTPDKKIYLMIQEPNKAVQVAELDSDTGTVTVLDWVDLDSQDLYKRSNYDMGVGINGPALCGWTDIREVNTETGEMEDILLFSGTSYTLAGSGGLEYYEDIQDFRVTEDGSVDVLRTNYYGSPAYVEHLRLETIQRTPVVFCAPVVSDWFKRQISRFNQENDEYYIVVEEMGLSDGNMEEQYETALEDYVRRIGIQVSTGKGPDILVGEDILGGNVPDMIEKGVLEDLRPHMERTGLKEEDYFPMTFDAWRNGDEIYSVCTNPLTYTIEADRNVMGSEPDIRETVDGLLAFNEKAVYLEGFGSRELLRLFLEGSEDLWGMVDWETGTCDFGGGLFADLLETAKRYGDDDRNNYQRIAQKARCLEVFEATVASELEERGLVLAGWMFDDGCHAVAEDEPVAMNASSVQKEGAWEFLSFLLGEEAQKDVMFYPVNKNMFAEWVDRRFDLYTHDLGLSYSIRGANRITGEWEIIKEYGEEDRDFLENEKTEYFIKILEEARYLPSRPTPVVDMVCEESEDYFNGSKCVEEIVAVLENRVTLYLNEHGK